MPNKPTYKELEMALNKAVKSNASIINQLSWIQYNNQERVKIISDLQDRIEKLEKSLDDRDKTIKEYTQLLIRANAEKKVAWDSVERVFKQSRRHEWALRFACEMLDEFTEFVPSSNYEFITYVGEEMRLKQWLDHFEIEAVKEEEREKERVKKEYGDGMARSVSSDMHHRVSQEYIRNIQEPIDSCAELEEKLNRLIDEVVIKGRTCPPIYGRRRTCPKEMSGDCKKCWKKYLKEE